MGNAHEDALGKESEKICPRMPKSIRQYMAFLMKDGKTLKKTFTRADSGCALTRTCTENDLLNGGNEALFLTAIFWAAELDCSYSVGQVGLKKSHGNPDIFFTFHKDKMYNAPTLKQTLEKQISLLDRKHAYHVLWNNFHTTALISIRNDIQEVNDYIQTAFYSAAQNNMYLLGIIIGIHRKEQNMGHAISVYPCYSKDGLRWICCNSQADPLGRVKDCSKAGFIPFMMSLSYYFDLFNSVTFVFKTV